MSDTVTSGIRPMAHDMSRYQRLIFVEGGSVTGKFKVSPPLHEGGHGEVEANGVVLWDEDSDSGLILHSNDMMCFVDDGVAELAYCNSNKEAAILAAWPHIKLAVEAAAAAFPAPVPKWGQQ